MNRKGIAYNLDCLSVIEGKCRKTIQVDGCGPIECLPDYEINCHHVVVSDFKGVRQRFFTF
ncbi:MULTISPECIES: hypothetical protein [Bacillus]|uniref:hypothetical protein n=1 Tax=Bacillus TaxID=1386 RepID=UPI0013716F4B|nr:hypothetical protein [Bacillus thuringiensis]